MAGREVSLKGFSLLGSLRAPEQATPKAAIDIKLGEYSAEIYHERDTILFLGTAFLTTGLVRGRVIARRSIADDQLSEEVAQLTSQLNGVLHSVEL